VVSLDEIISRINRYFNTQDSAKKQELLNEIVSKTQQYLHEHPELQNKTATQPLTPPLPPPPPSPQPSQPSQSKTIQQKPTTQAKPPASQLKPKEMYYYDGSLHPAPPSDPDKKYYVYRREGDKYVYTGYFTTKRIEELSKKESKAWKKYNELIEKRKQLEMAGHWKDDEWYKVFKEQQRWKEIWKGYKRQVDELRVKAGIMSHMPGNALPTAPLLPPPPERGVLDYTSPVDTKKASGKVYRNEGLKSGLYTPSGFIPLSKPKSSSKSGLIGRDAGLRVTKSNSGRGKKSKKVFNEAEVGLIPPDVVLGRIETEIKSKPYTELEVEAYKLSKELEKEYNQILSEKQKLEELKLKARNNPALAKQINERIAKFNEKVAKFNEKRAKLERMSKELEVRAPSEVKFLKAVSNIRKDYEKYLDSLKFGPLKGLAMGAFDTTTGLLTLVAGTIHEERARLELANKPKKKEEFFGMEWESFNKQLSEGFEWAKSKPQESIPYVASSLVTGALIGKAGGKSIGVASDIGRSFKAKLTEFKPVDAMLITSKGAKRIKPQKPLIPQVGLTKLETVKPVIVETTEKGLVKTGKTLTLVEKSAGVGKALQVSKSEKAVRGVEFKAKTTRLGYEVNTEPFEVIYKFKNRIGQKAYARVRYGEGETSVAFKSPKKAGLLHIKVEETHPIVERFDEAFIKQTKPRGGTSRSLRIEEVAKDFEEKVGLGKLFERFEKAKAEEQAKPIERSSKVGRQEVKTVERTAGRVHYFDIDVGEFVRREIVEKSPKPSTFFTPTMPMVRHTFEICSIPAVGALNLLQVSQTSKQPKTTHKIREIVEIRPQEGSSPEYKPSLAFQLHVPPISSGLNLLIPKILPEKPKTTPKPHIGLENTIVPSTRTDEGTGERTKTVPFVGISPFVGTIPEVNTIVNTIPNTLQEVNTLTNVNVKTTQTTETAQRTTTSTSPVRVRPVSPPAPPVTPPLATLPPLLTPPQLKVGGGVFNIPTVGGVKAEDKRKQSYVGLLAGFAELNAFELFTGKKGAHLLVPEIASPYWEKSLASAGFVEVPTAQEILGSKKKKKKGRGKKK